MAQRLHYSRVMFRRLAVTMLTLLPTTLSAQPSTTPTAPETTPAPKPTPAPSKAPDKRIRQAITVGVYLGKANVSITGHDGGDDAIQMMASLGFELPLARGRASVTSELLLFHSAWDDEENFGGLLFGGRGTYYINPRSQRRLGLWGALHWGRGSHSEAINTASTTRLSAGASYQIHPRFNIGAYVSTTILSGGDEDFDLFDENETIESASSTAAGLTFATRFAR